MSTSRDMAIAWVSPHKCGSPMQKPYPYFRRGAANLSNLTARPPGLLQPCYSVGGEAPLAQSYRSASPTLFLLSSARLPQKTRTAAKAAHQRDGPVPQYRAAERGRRCPDES